MKQEGIQKSTLMDLYVEKGKSVHQIARTLSCSDNKVTYWLRKYSIAKRSISEAVYIRHNPTGDPFRFQQPRTKDEWFLFGLGVGLYWGEGNKKNRTAIRLGNTDPYLIKRFLFFLDKIYRVKKERIHFGLQVFSDMSPEKAKQFWCKTLRVSPSSFGKIIVTSSRGIGTYREKTRYGVLTVYVSNTKLRDLLNKEIEKQASIRYHAATPNEE